MVHRLSVPSFGSFGHRSQTDPCSRKPLPARSIFTLASDSFRKLSRVVLGVNESSKNLG